MSILWMSRSFLWIFCGHKNAVNLVEWQFEFWKLFFIRKICLKEIFEEAFYFWWSLSKELSMDHEELVLMKLLKSLSRSFSSFRAFNLFKLLTSFQYFFEETCSEWVFINSKAFILKAFIEIQQRALFRLVNVRPNSVLLFLKFKCMKPLF